MTNFADLERYARYTMDEQGNPVVMFPEEIWKSYAADQTQLEPHIERELTEEEAKNTPAGRLLALMETWEDDPNEDYEGWYEEFTQFLADNPIRFRTPEELGITGDDGQ